MSLRSILLGPNRSRARLRAKLVVRVCLAGGKEVQRRGEEGYPRRGREKDEDQRRARPCNLPHHMAKGTIIVRARSYKSCDVFRLQKLQHPVVTNED